MRKFVILLLPLFFCNCLLDDNMVKKQLDPEIAEKGVQELEKNTFTGDDVSLSEWEKAKKKIMQEDLEEIEEYLQNNHGNWESWYKSLQNLRQNLLWANERWETLITKNKKHYFENMNWLYFNFEDENSQLWPKNAVQSLIKANDFLRKRNIGFIVVPVPPKEYFTVKFFGGNDFPVDNIVQPYRYKLFVHLLKNNIETVDLLPAIYNASSSDDKSPYYPTSDQHPTDFLIQIAVLKLLDRLDRFEFERLGPNSDLRLEPKKSKIPKQFIDRPYKRRYPKDYIIEATQVVHKDGTELKKAAQSQILIIGDSFAISTENRGIPSADIWAHIAHKTGIVPKVIAKPANGPNVNIELKLLDKKKALDQFKVCILFLDEKYLFFKDDQWK